MVRESGFDFRQGIHIFLLYVVHTSSRANLTSYTHTMGTESLELESAIECNVDFLRRRLTLGKIK
jgi:hypothetical protein